MYKSGFVSTKTENIFLTLYWIKYMGFYRQVQTAATNR